MVVATSSRYRLRQDMATSSSRYRQATTSSRYHLRQDMATPSSYHESPQIRDEVVVKLQVRRKNVEDVLLMHKKNVLAVNIKKMMIMMTMKHHHHHFYYYYD